MSINEDNNEETKECELIEKGFKVLSKSGDHYYSAIAQGGSVGYKENEWTFPAKSCGSLCVFDNYNDALSFKSRYGLDCIKPCEYEPSSSKEIWQPKTRHGGWVVYPDYLESRYLYELPRGTRLARKVRII